MKKILISAALAALLGVTAVAAKDHKTGGSPGRSGENSNSVSGTSGNQGNGQSGGNAGGTRPDNKSKPEPDTESAIATNGNDRTDSVWIGRCFTDGRTTLIFNGATHASLVDSRGLPELYYEGCLDWLQRVGYLDENGVRR